MPSGSSFFRFSASRVESARLPRFSDLRREIRARFSDRKYCLAEEVYIASKRSDKMRLAKRLVDAWLADYKADEAQEYFYQCLLYIFAESGADGVDEVLGYLRNKRDIMAGREPFRRLADNDDIDFGDFIITRQGDFCLLISLDLDKADDLFTLVTLAEVEALCAARHEQASTCYDATRAFVSADFAREGVPLTAEAVAELGFDADAIPVARPVVFG